MQSVRTDMQTQADERSGIPWIDALTGGWSRPRLSMVLSDSALTNDRLVSQSVAATVALGGGVIFLPGMKSMDAMIDVYETMARLGRGNIQVLMPPGVEDGQCLDATVKAIVKHRWPSPRRLVVVESLSGVMANGTRTEKDCIRITTGLRVAAMAQAAGLIVFGHCSERVPNRPTGHRLHSLALASTPRQDVGTILALENDKVAWGTRLSGTQDCRCHKANIRWDDHRLQYVAEEAYAGTGNFGA